MVEIYITHDSPILNVPIRVYTSNCSDVNIS